MRQPRRTKFAYGAANQPPPQTKKERQSEPTTPRKLNKTSKSGPRLSGRERVKSRGSEAWQTITILSESRKAAVLLRKAVLNRDVRLRADEQQRVEMK